MDSHKIPFQECPSSVEKIDYLLKINIKVNDLYPEYLKLYSIRKIGSISAVSRVGVRAHFPEQVLLRGSLGIILKIWKSPIQVFFVYLLFNFRPIFMTFN